MNDDDIFVEHYSFSVLSTPKLIIGIPIGLLLLQIGFALISFLLFGMLFSLIYVAIALILIDVLFGFYVNLKTERFPRIMDVIFLNLKAYFLFKFNSKRSVIYISSIYNKKEKYKNVQEFLK